MVTGLHKCRMLSSRRGVCNLFRLLSIYICVYTYVYIHTYIHTYFLTYIRVEGFTIQMQPSGESASWIGILDNAPHANFLLSFTEELGKFDCPWRQQPKHEVPDILRLTRNYSYASRRNTVSSVVTWKTW